MTDSVSNLYQCHDSIKLTSIYLGVSEIINQLAVLQHNNYNRCVFETLILQGSSLTLFSGIIAFLVTDWTHLIANLILCGELLSCSILVILTCQKQYYASYRDNSLTCHVSAIEKDAHLSHCNLPTCADRRRRN